MHAWQTAYQLHATVAQDYQLHATVAQDYQLHATVAQDFSVGGAIQKKDKHTAVLSTQINIYIHEINIIY